MDWPILLAIWGCIPEFTKDCLDMTNSSSTYLGIVGGVAIGAVISWWIYNRQKKTGEQQDFLLRRIRELDENHDAILKKLEDFDDHYEHTLDTILELSKKIDAVLEKKEETKDI
ncbi:MAG: hypothetical protein HY295_03415 [Thaumarchaeota archaeon]|nr:hypothetical protein [Nitrososphaerota archaeon]